MCFVINKRHFPVIDGNIQIHLKNYLTEICNSATLDTFHPISQNLQKAICIPFLLNSSPFTSEIVLQYYFALSNGVPCLSHTWLQRCCKENKLIDKEDYLLEAGCDYISGEMIMAPKDTRVFAGRKVCSLSCAVKWLLKVVQRPDCFA